MPDKLLLIALATLLINMPFGYWRAGVQKFSLQWFIAVHAAVPCVIIMRRMAELDWQLLTLAPLVACYFAGQWAGARLRRERSIHTRTRKGA